VAVSVCLTSVTRLVEEERGTIGTFKALGYSNSLITMKYVVFALISCVIGGILGGLMGFFFFPKALWGIIMVLHNLPEFMLYPDFKYVTVGTVIYVVTLIAAAVYSCVRSLKSKPSELMRPRPPRSGGRIFIERIKILWRNLKFLGKVTARNLFRYKKRMLMTLFGVTGCTALIVTGFALKNSAKNLVPKQFDDVTVYDMIVVADDDADVFRSVEDILKDDNRIKEFLAASLGSITVIGENHDSLEVQMVILDSGSEYQNFFKLSDEKSGKALVLEDEGIILTENAAKLLDIKQDDIITVRGRDNEEFVVRINAVAHTFIGNSVYISRTYYEKLYSEYKPNAFFIKNSDSVTIDGRTALRSEMLENKDILSVVNVDSLRKTFNDSVSVVDSVVFILISLAACLAFVVLYTLANINISERRREMATIKVLGFYNRELYQYVNRETLILAVVGIALGLPAGRGIGEFIVRTIRMPAISIHVDILPISYVAAALMTLAFTLITNIFTNAALRKLDMIESLKSVE